MELETFALEDEAADAILWRTTFVSIVRRQHLGIDLHGRSLPPSRPAEAFGSRMICSFKIRILESGISLGRTR